MDTFNNRLILLRNALGKKEGKKRVSQEEMARRTGVTKHTWWRYENAVRTPDVEFLQKLVHTVNLNPLWFLIGKGAMFLGDSDRDMVVAEKLLPYVSSKPPQTEPSRSVFLLNKALSNISNLLRQHPELIKVCSDITELFVYLFDKPYEKELFMEILECMVGSLREKRLKLVK